MGEGLMRVNPPSPQKKFTSNLYVTIILCSFKYNFLLDFQKNILK